MRLKLLLKVVSTNRSATRSLSLIYTVRISHMNCIFYAPQLSIIENEC